MSVRKLHGGRSFISFVTTSFLVLALFVGVFGIVWTVTGITTLEYQIGKLEKEKALALKNRKSIEAELFSIRSLQHVENKGLDLAIPDRQRLVYVKRGGVTIRQASQKLHLRGSRLSE
jgi:hypothetical protein